MSERLGMSSLTLSLILLAVAALAAVIGYNAWVNRRRAALREPGPLGAWPGAQGGRSEPTIGDTHGWGSGTAPQSDGSQIRGSGPGGDGQPGSASHGGAFGAVAGGGLSIGPESSGPRLDPLTDCIIEFDLPEPIAAERILPTAQTFRRVGGKPVIVEVSSGAAGEPADWTLPAAHQRFARVRVGVLLANRHGPLNAMEFSEFVTGVQALAEQLDLLGDTPDMNAVLHRARALDEACAALDAQIGLNVQAREALGVGELARLAQALGCSERGNNRYALLTDHAEVVYSLSLADEPGRLSLLLDVPRAPLAAKPWQAMVAGAQHCAQRLDAQLVDDQGRTLSEPNLARIEAQLQERQAALSAAGFAPGSILALRVFN